MQENTEKPILQSSSTFSTMKIVTITGTLSVVSIIAATLVVINLSSSESANTNSTSESQESSIEATINSQSEFSASSPPVEPDENGIPAGKVVYIEEYDISLILFNGWTTKIANADIGLDDDCAVYAPMFKDPNSCVENDIPTVEFFYNGEYVFEMTPMTLSGTGVCASEDCSSAVVDIQLFGQPYSLNFIRSNLFTAGEESIYAQGSINISPNATEEEKDWVIAILRSIEYGQK